ncbi:MAG: TraR/DksA C4-type zinc finger protein [Nitrospiraceae bacterium]|nr:TraR/DksA C4-type zinc finger protein [Nitrospiraceae bacterium]
MALRKPTSGKKAAPSAKKAPTRKAAAKNTVRKKTAPKKADKPSAGKTRKKTAAPKAARPVSGKKPAIRKITPKKTAPVRKGISPRKVEGIVEKKIARLLDIRKALLKKKEAIVKEAKQEIAKYISGENRQLVDTAIDEGDWAVVDISEDINLRRLDAHRKTMRDIDEVVRKIDEGTYGVCEECGEEISEQRLKVIPTASLCITCQENKEQFDAISREEVM